MFDWYNEESKLTLERKYLPPGETVKDAAWRIANRSAELLEGKGLVDTKEYAAHIYYMIAKGWIALSSPIWSNFGTSRGASISCFSSYCPDNMSGIMDTLKEVAMMTKYGGGTAVYFGDLRQKDASVADNGTSSGPISFMQMFDTAMRVTSQGSVRRGSMAAYMPITHPDILDFLAIKDKGHPIQDLSYGITVEDAWLEELILGDEGKLTIWAEVLKSRKEKGYPYIVFSDSVNNSLPEAYKKHDLKITHSNLCSEILLNTDEGKSFVCCLTAMMAPTFDEWSGTDAVKLTTYFLDTVMEDFIEKASGVPGLERALNFAKQERALALGLTGWHTYLQSKMIPFDSLSARHETSRMFGEIKDQSEKASIEMAQVLGQSEFMKVTPFRNSALRALAPNTGSSAIMGQGSQGVEPIRSNIFMFESAGRQCVRKNPQLEKLLEGKGKNTREVWTIIQDAIGSVQHLDFLTNEEKAVFKCFWEIDQYELLRQAGIRQTYIDQGVSLNIFCPPGMSAREINKLHLFAWKQGVKTLYYLRSEHPSVWEKVVKSQSNCSSCEG